jgi:hypothetical protein
LEKELERLKKEKDRMEREHEEHEATLEKEHKGEIAAHKKMLRERDEKIRILERTK